MSEIWSIVVGALHNINVDIHNKNIFWIIATTLYIVHYLTEIKIFPLIYVYTRMYLRFAMFVRQIDGLYWRNELWFDSRTGLTIYNFFFLLLFLLSTDSTWLTCVCVCLWACASQRNAASKRSWLQTRRRCCCCLRMTIRFHTYSIHRA